MIFRGVLCSVRTQFFFIGCAMIASIGCEAGKKPDTNVTEPRSGASSASSGVSGAAAGNIANATVGAGKEIPASSIQVEWVQGALSQAVLRNGSEAELFCLPETTGGGVGIFDLDRDGSLDMVCAGGGIPLDSEKRFRGCPGSVLRGVANWKWDLVSSNAHVNFSNHFNSAVSVADFDGDGFSDFLITGYGGLQLFHNLGDGTFELLGESSGVVDKEWSSSAAFLDLNMDGNLDLYIAHYADWRFDNNPVCYSNPSAANPTAAPNRDYCGPRDFKGIRDLVLESNGDGTFRDVTVERGFDASLRGLGVIAADLDGDRDTDIYVANDVDPNLLYRNDGKGNFTEIGRRAGVATNDQGKPEGSMGIAVGDYNLDGKLDLWVTNYQNEVGALYKNNGNLSFNYASQSTRINLTDEATVGWGTAFCDLDLDGDEDILAVNGHEELVSSGSTFQQKPHIIENLDGKQFRLVRADKGYLATPQSSRGLALADFDRDGRIDFVTSRLNEEFAVVRNATSSPGSYLTLRLVGTVSNRDAIGATVTLQAGDRSWVRTVYGGGSYASASDRAVHFGIPSGYKNEKFTVVVRWPSGIDQTVHVESSNRELLLVEGH